MNYLAHILLSGPNRRLQLGNFIGDAVKGKAYKHYPRPLAEGILLHRAIDAYTDSHPAVRGLIQQLKPDFGRYSAALLDIYFDYLLASHFGDFSRVPLKRFSRRFYITMILYRHRLPARMRRFMWHFILTGRLGRYASLRGVRESLTIMARYGRIRVSPRKATDYLAAHQDELWAVFQPFFADLQKFCEGYLGTVDKGAYIERRKF